MASGERRLGTSRRGMTVLGKIPTPSAPKPINLPSQRLENQGLESSVEIVPRGTFSWGNLGNSNAVGDNKAGASVIMPLLSTSTGAWSGGTKAQGHSTSGNDVGNLVESNELSSSATGTRPLPAHTITTATTWGSNGTTQANVQMQSSGFMVIPVESATPVSKASADSLPQHSDALSNQPPPAGPTHGDLEMLPCLEAGPGHVRFPEGLQGHGNDRRTFVRQDIPLTGSVVPVRVTLYPGPSSNEASLCSFGATHPSSPHDRDMLSVRTLNSQGVYGSYGPHPTPAECLSQQTLYESFTPQIRHVEQTATSRNCEVAQSGNMHYRMGSSLGGNKLLSQRTEIFFCDSGQEFHKYRVGNSGSVRSRNQDQGCFGSTTNADANDGTYPMSPHGKKDNHMIPRNFRRHDHPKKPRNFVKEETSSLAMQVPEKKIILLTKPPKEETLRAETIVNNITVLPDCDGSKNCEQVTGLPNLKVENQITENGSIMFKATGVKISDESSERTTVDANELRRSTKVTNFPIVKQDNRWDDENLSAVESCFDNLQASSTNTGACSGNEGLAEFIAQEEQNVLVAANCPHGESAKGTCKVATSGGLDPVGGHSVCKMPAKNIVAECVTRGNDQRLKIKAINHKSEKAWRPKSPLADSVPAGNASSPKVAGRGRTSARNYSEPMLREGTSQECCTESMTVAEAFSLVQNNNLHKLGNIHCLPSSLSAGSNIKVEPSSLFVDFVDRQPKITEDADEQPTKHENERITSKDASNIAGPVGEPCSAEAFDYVETEGSYQKTKGRPSYHHKAEKGWRPKSPAVEIVSVTESIFKSEASSLLPVPEPCMNSIQNLKCIEQECPQALDAYDYEGQRARMKEIAAQRAKQRQKEEEERAREQKAKALAKLEELDMRKLGIEVDEHATMVLADEAFKRKTKKRLNPSRDVSVLDSKKQQSDGALVWDHSEISPRAAPIAENKEAVSNKERVIRSSRNKVDQSDRSSSKILEENKVHEPDSSASTRQVQRRIPKKDSSLHQDSVPSGQPSKAGSSSGEKYGTIIDEVPKVGRARRQKGAIHNQVGHVAFVNGSESVLRRIEEQKEPRLSPLVSQSGNQCQGKAADMRRWSLQSTAEELKVPKIGELLASEEQPPSSCILDKTNGLSLSSGSTRQQELPTRDIWHKQSVNMETNVNVEQTEIIATSNAKYVGEKVSQLHVSWKQKNLSEPQLCLKSDETNSVISKDMQNGLGEGSAIHSRKSYKPRKGGKQLSNGQKGLLHLGMCEVGERMTVALGSMDSELTHSNATSDLKHEEEIIATLKVKDGRSYDSWRRQRNINTAGRGSKQSVKESNFRFSAHLASTDEAVSQEIIDPFLPFAVSTSQTSYTQNPKVNAKFSPKSSFGASQWQKIGSMKPAGKPAPSLGNQTGSQACLEEPPQVSSSWLRVGPSVQPLNQELEQETANYQRSLSFRFQADMKPPLETSAPNPKHQETKFIKGRVGSDPLISGKNRFSDTKHELHRVSKQHQIGFPTSRPHDHQHHEAVSEYRGEQCLSSRGNKLSRQRQSNGCSTISDLNRRDAKPAIKTGVSY